LRTGVYQFDYDFNQTVVGDYSVYLFFDGKTKVVNVNVIDVPAGLNFITGRVFYSDGTINVRNALLFIGLLLSLLIILYFIIVGIRRRRKKAKEKSKHL
jgi:beta-lactamase regulating signal transducer with metallopeptidase domain